MIRNNTERYKIIVEAIKSITKLDVPVIYDDRRANCGGTSYFGLSEEACELIMPEECQDDPMFEIEDFITNEHIHLYHVGLASDVGHRSEEFIYKITNNQLKDNDIRIKLTKELLELFIILHEFGHAHHLFIDYKMNLEKYLSETYEEHHKYEYLIRSQGLAGTEEGHILHNSKLTEQHANRFALKYFEEVLSVINKDFSKEVI